MLSKMGWESGKGLGAKENGITTHVKAVKRKDNLGKETKQPLLISLSTVHCTGQKFLLSIG